MATQGRQLERAEQMRLARLAESQVSIRAAARQVGVSFRTAKKYYHRCLHCVGGQTPQGACGWCRGTGWRGV